MRYFIIVDNSWYEDIKIEYWKELFINVLLTSIIYQTLWKGSVSLFVRLAKTSCVKVSLQVICLSSILEEQDLGYTLS